MSTTKHKVAEEKGEVLHAQVCHFIDAIMGAAQTPLLTSRL